MQKVTKIAKDNNLLAVALGGLTAVGVGYIAFPKVMKKVRENIVQTKPATTLQANLKAFLYMLRRCEGTAGPNGYRTFFGGTTFTSYAKHPNKRNCASKWCSTAAGGYQFVIATWNRLAKKLSLPDFSPESQDRAAAEYVAELGAMPYIEAGDIVTAIKKCSPAWASLPYSKANQPMQKLENALTWYQAHGGYLKK